MSQKEPTKIKYAAIEVIRNDGKTADDIECGAVMGICRRKDGKEDVIPFLALVVSTSAIRLYNLNEYKIVTFDILDDSTRYMTVFTDTEDDQLAAIQMVDQLVEQMEGLGRLMANDTHKELIDVEQYKDMPDSVLEGDNLSDNKKTGDLSTSTSTSTTTETSTTTYVKKEPTVLVIKRRGKLPSLDRLKTMRQKVIMLANGVFTIPPLPILECDIENEKKLVSLSKK